MKSNSMITQIQSRRAVFPAQYNSEEITKEEIKIILETANWAPTHKRTEPWRFKVCYGASKHELGNFLAKKYKQTAANFSEFKYDKISEKAQQAACIIAICMQRDQTASIPEWEEIASTAMAVQNMWLTAHSMHIGAYWSSPSSIEFFDEFIPLQHGERCLGFFYLGRFDGALPQGERKTQIEQKTIWI